MSVKRYLWAILPFFIVFSEIVVAQPFTIPRSEVTSIKDSQQGLDYSLHIKLPKDYSSRPNKRYPVVYITDSSYAFQIISGATRYPMNVNKMQQAILVGIGYSKEAKGDRSRVRDYTPWHDKRWRKLTGGAHQHMQFIERDVFNYIDSTYRTDKDNRIFVGNSLGGLFGSYILLTKPQMFASYIFGSPSYWFYDHKIFEFAQSKQTLLNKVKTKVFIAVGGREMKGMDTRENMVTDAQRFYKEVLQQAPHIESKLYIIPEANHETAFPTTATQGLYQILGKPN